MKRCMRCCTGSSPERRKLLTRRGVLIEEQGQTTMADNDNDSDSDAARTLRPLQAAASYLPHRAWTTRRPEGADAAECNAEGDGLQSDAVRQAAQSAECEANCVHRRTARMIVVEGFDHAQALAQSFDQVASINLGDRSSGLYAHRD